MRIVSGLYKPRRVVKDVYEVPSYYQADDVQLSPATRVGDAGRRRLRRVRIPVRHQQRIWYIEPLTGASAAGTLAQAALYRPPRFGPRAAFGRLVGWLTLLLAALLAGFQAIADFLADSWRGLRHGHVWSQQYVAGQGVRRRLSAPAAALARRGLPVIVMLLLVGGSLTLALTDQPAPDNRPAPAAGHKHGGQATTTTQPAVGPSASTDSGRFPVTNSNSDAQSTTGQTSGGGASTGPASGGSSTTSADSTSSSTPAAGGYGAGDPAAEQPTEDTTADDGTDGGGLSVPGVTTPIDVIIPGQSLQLGDQTIISTSPIDITLN